MRFPVEHSTGQLTNGEARTLAAMACEENPETLEVFLVIAFRHNDPGVHSVIVSGNITHSGEAVMGLLSLAAETVQGSGNTVKDYAPGQTDNKILRFCGHIRTRGFPFYI
jgi:hypothetical protein